MGKRTSVYLSDGLAAAVEASGVPLAELIRRGLGAPGPAAAGQESVSALTGTGTSAPGRPETPGEIRAKVTTASQAAELGRAIAAERRQAPARPVRPAHSLNCSCGVCKLNT